MGPYLLKNVPMYLLVQLKYLYEATDRALDNSG